MGVLAERVNGFLAGHHGQFVSGPNRTYPHIFESANSKISPFTRIVFKSNSPVDVSPIRKEKVADSKISGYVWTGPQ